MEKGPSFSGHTVLHLDFSYVDLVAQDYSKRVKKKTISLAPTEIHLVGVHFLKVGTAVFPVRILHHFIFLFGLHVH